MEDTTYNSGVSGFYTSPLTCFGSIVSMPTRQYRFALILELMFNLYCDYDQKLDKTIM